MSASRESLVERFRRGDPDAIRHVARLAGRIVAERGYYVPHAEREDVVQETLIHVHQTVTSAGFGLSRGFEGIVRTIASRRCVDWMRRHRPLVTMEEEPRNPSAAGPEQVLLSDEKLARGRRALRALSRMCHQLIRLRFGEDLSYRQIAERTGRTEHGVRTETYRCLKRARSHFLQADEGPGQDAQ